MPIDGSESVLVVEAARLARVMMWPAGGNCAAGFYPVPPPRRDAFLAALLDGARFVPRTAELERDESLRQVIPYTLLYRDDGAWLWYQRPAKNGEARLAGRRSVGWAGHVNTGDLPARAAPDPGGARGASYAVRAAVARELSEEAGFWPRDYGPPEMVGLLDDRRDAVGRVHVGLVHVARVAPLTIPRVDPAEIAVWGWADADTLASVRMADPDRPWESWSALLLPSLARLGAADDPEPG